MSTFFFTEVLKALGKKLNFESISNLYGNSFALKDAQKHIEEAFPLKGKKKIDDGTMSIFNKAKVIKVGKRKSEDLAKMLNLGAGDDFSYLNDMFDDMVKTPAQTDEDKKG